MPRYELIAGSSKKFWDVRVKGSDVIVSYGRIGSSGQTKTKSQESPAATKEASAKLTASKVKKGYVKVQKSGVKKESKKSGVAKKHASARKAAKTRVPTTKTVRKSTVPGKTNAQQKKLKKKSLGIKKAIALIQRGQGVSAKGLAAAAKKAAIHGHPGVFPMLKKMGATQKHFNDALQS